MSHAHGGELPARGRAFSIGIALNLGFVIVETVAGFTAHSLALLADAGHNLSDVLGLVIAWIAVVLGQRQATLRRTYGLKRSSIVAALLNSVLLLIAVGAIVAEAVRRFGDPRLPATGVLIWVAAVGVIINASTAVLFLRGRKEDLNIQGAFIHMAADAGVSLGVIVAAVAMGATGWTWLDPAVSLGIAGVILAGTWGLLKESLNLSLDAVPSAIDAEQVRKYLADHSEVTNVHDLHIWPLSTTEIAVTAHLVVSSGTERDRLLRSMTTDLIHRFGIHHVTLQVEAVGPGSADCKGGCRILPSGGSTTTFSNLLLRQPSEKP
ncbi:MAG: cation diffusion facilitator family transporter [Candidatus Eisenbacteria bacterium]|nr:cation diffusion facilitator family transporter [Candidatus Eisenbacteria bacterium]